MAHEADEKGYFHSVARLTPTRFWINNPTGGEARQAIDAGAVACTTNPTYAAKMAASKDDAGRFHQALETARAHHAGAAPSTIAREVQRLLVAPLLGLFRPLFDESGGRLGFVSIQGDPFAEDDADQIVRESLEDRRLGPNVIAKVPVTAPGLEAIERLIEGNVPVIATEVMSIAQVVAVCETYRAAAARSGHRPPFFVTHITGIFDQYLAERVREEKLPIDPELLSSAGVSVARRQLRLMRERDYPGILLGGGARSTLHFTEFVGEPAHITINWKGTADELISQAPPVISRAGCPVPESFIGELAAALPDYRRAYSLHGLREEEFRDFGPVALFRRSFEAGWQALLDSIPAG